MQHQSKFISDIKEEFNLIADKYGFEIVDTDDWCVHLHSNKVCLCISYDSLRSFELRICISLLNECGSDGSCYDVGEIAEALNAPDASRWRLIQNADLDGMKAIYLKVSEFLENKCSLLLAGDEKAFSKIKSSHLRNSQKYTQQLQYEAIRDKIDLAWKTNNYQEFLDLSRGYEIYLSQSDLKKIEYATRKIAE